jgi:hypothetical protein
MTDEDDVLLFSQSSGWYIYDGKGDKYFGNTESNLLSDPKIGYSWLRTTIDPNHKFAPVIIERDNRWTIKPSFFAKD